MRRRIKAGLGDAIAERNENALERENEVKDEMLEEDDTSSIFGDEPPPVSAHAQRFDKFKKIAKAFEGFRPASESLTYVRAVPTYFVGYDHGTKVGGHPTERISLLHGPSGEGKTYFTLGLMKSFLALDNPVLNVDAERTTDKGFAQLAIDELVDHPLFFYERPNTYEEVVARVRKWCNIVLKLREDGELHEDACGLIVIDSIRKMVPADQWDRIMELAKAQKGDKKEKLRDRSAQIKAMMNAAWCDELIPLLEQTGCTMVIIARETEDPDADARSRMFGTNYKTGGGKALYYDASLDIRIERATYVKKDMGEGARPVIYGERHRITIKKSKIGGKEDKTIVAYFHTSNGVLIPAGFDKARDVLDLARTFGIVGAPETKGKKKAATGGGGWIAWRDGDTTHRWQGEHNAVKKLSESKEVLARLEAEVREKFKVSKPTEYDGDGVLVE